MRLAFDVSCPSCEDGTLEVGPSERFSPTISRRAVACSCGRGWVVTATMVPTAKGRLDHITESLFDA